MKKKFIGIVGALIVAFACMTTTVKASYEDWASYVVPIKKMSIWQKSWRIKYNILYEEFIDLYGYGIITINELTGRTSTMYRAFKQQNDFVMRCYYNWYILDTI